MTGDIDSWLFRTVLPHWLEHGVDAGSGVFVECLDSQGAPMPEVPRRGRVAPRQLFTLARARRLGFDDKRVPGVLERGASTLLASRTPERGFPSKIDAQGCAVEADGVLYDHAFVLLAGAELQAAGVSGGAELAAQASELVDTRFRDPAGGYHTVMDMRGDKLANPHMHLLEASLLHAQVTGSGAAQARVREIADIALAHMLRDGVVAERMGPDFEASEQNWVEPGHCYEWAFLLHEAAEMLNDAALAGAARALFERSEAFVEADGLVVDRVGAQASYRLWPQLERLRCLVSFGQHETAGPLLSTIRAHYLDRGPEAGWIDKLDADRQAVGERVPASMLYHLMTALPPATGRTLER